MNAKEFAIENAGRRAKIGSRACRIIGYSEINIYDVLVELEYINGGHNGWLIKGVKNIVYLIDNTDITLGYWSSPGTIEIIPEEVKPIRPINLYSKQCKYCSSPARISKNFMLCSNVCPRSKKQYLTPLLKTIKPLFLTNKFIICPKCDEQAIFIRRLYTSERDQDHLNISKIPRGSKSSARLARCMMNHSWLHLLKVNDKIKKRIGSSSWDGFKWIADA